MRETQNEQAWGGLYVGRSEMTLSTLGHVHSTLDFWKVLNGRVTNGFMTVAFF